MTRRLTHLRVHHCWIEKGFLLYRRDAMRAAYFGVDRPDISQWVKVRARAIRQLQTRAHWIAEEPGPVSDSNQTESVFFFWRTECETRKVGGFGQKRIGLEMYCADDRQVEWRSWRGIPFAEIFADTSEHHWTQLGRS